MPVTFRIHHRSTFSTPLPQVSVVVTDKMWVDGKMVQETRYESEKEIDAPQEEEGEDTPEWDMEEEEASWMGRGLCAGSISWQGCAGTLLL
jgi:hypothetical protein